MVLILARIAAIAAAAGLLAAPDTAAAQTRTPPDGSLRCEMSGGVSFILGSKRHFECVFSPIQGPTEFYNGRITRLGIDIGFMRSGVIVWGVFAPGIVGRTGGLDGNYVGISAQAAAGAGVGANALVGTGNVMLNPISVEGFTGLNIAAGITGLELEFVRPFEDRPQPLQPRR